MLAARPLCFVAMSRGGASALFLARRRLAHARAHALRPELLPQRYKERMLPIRRRNRLYVSWGPADADLDCKARSLHA